jgi:hypothetical protein
LLINYECFFNNKQCQTEHVGALFVFNLLLEGENMSYKCSCCGVNDVVHPGDICEVCFLSTKSGADTHAHPSSSSHRPKVLLNGGNDVAGTDSYRNDIGKPAYQTPTTPDTPSSTPGVPAFDPFCQPGSSKAGAQTAPGSISGCLTQGISKNIIRDDPKRSILYKWIRCLFTGIPFTLDNEVTSFQVYPDYSGAANNSSGYACDQVTIFGHINAGTVSENNEVTVFGRRTSKNTIIANKLINVASGASISPTRTLGFIPVWIVTLILAVAAYYAVTTLGVSGIIWVVVALLCLTNLPAVFKLILAIFAALFSGLASVFRRRNRR